MRQISLIFTSLIMPKITTFSLLMLAILIVSLHSEYNSQEEKEFQGTICPGFISLLEKGEKPLYQGETSPYPVTCAVLMVVLVSVLHFACFFHRIVQVKHSC